MPHDILKKYNHLLSEAADELDIAPSKYQQVVKSYNAVGNWLNGGVYAGATDGVSIHVQGSFALGTVIKPPRTARKIGYDIDLVCQMSIPKESTDASSIKSAVGDRLKANENYKRMLDDEGKRCWTLEYADEGFHIDVLPSVAEDPATKSALMAGSEYPHFAESAIAITNKPPGKGYSWSSSNPQGYAQWFREQNLQAFNLVAPQARQLLLERNRGLFASVEDVPEQLIKTPLQQAIQIMKRHRDLRFSGHELEDCKPISMILTTLGARLYDQEPDVFTALKNIVQKVQHYTSLMESVVPLQGQAIQRRQDGTWYIGNPVNGKENFADRWHEDGGARAEAFFEWASWANADLIEITRHQDIETLADLLEERLIEEPKAAQDEPTVTPPLSFPSPTPRVHHIEIREPSKPWRSEK